MFEIDVLGKAKEPAAERLPVYECRSMSAREVCDARTYGAGLYSIWGYVSVDSGRHIDIRSLLRRGETPDLEPKSKSRFFESQFSGKKPIKDGRFVSVE